MKADNTTPSRKRMLPVTYVCYSNPARLSKSAIKSLFELYGKNGTKVCKRLVDFLALLQTRRARFGRV
jgi:hypothetical protein